MRAAVVVLGDVGRSPRMQYHARALAGRDVLVDLVGHLESALPPAIRDDTRVTAHAVDAARPRGPEAPRGAFLVAAAWRAARQAFALARLLLWKLPRPDVILVQNPPALPLLPVALLAARLRSARLVVDWHNLTSAMLALRLGVAHPAVRLVGWAEGMFGRRADGHLFVSAAMAEALRGRWGLHGVVFRDHPHEIFRTVAALERSRMRRSLLDRLGCGDAEARVALVVGPTSWTADEDHDLLLDAIATWDAALDGGEGEIPKVVVLLTGRGPLRARFEERLASRPPSHVLVRTLWLEADEYPRVVAAADLGICLHRSASGFDLPMKIADLFGAGVPVCALDYGPCLAELVTHGGNGLLFSTAEDLAAVLHEVLGGFPADVAVLERLKRGVDPARELRWGEAWTREARPMLLPETGHHA